MSGGEAPRSVLFLCTHNAIRSPMAMALTRIQFGPLLRADSAGIRPGEEVSAMAVFVADEVGADIAAWRPKGLDAFGEYYDEGPFDLIVSLSPEAHHAALDLTPKLGLAAEYWPTFDPSLTEGSRDQVLLEYRTVRDGLAKRISARFPRPTAG
jgi:protein-tyrosine-phosphatase